MNSIQQNKFQDFIDNQFFVDWVKNPTVESDQYWKQYIAEHPSEKVHIDQAKYILARFQKEKKRQNDDDVRNVWLNIQARILNPPRKVRYLNVWLAAASILLIIGIGAGILFRIFQPRDTIVNYASITKMEPAGNEVKLILSDNSVKRFGAKDPAIKYNQHGEILVDSKTLANAISNPNKSDRETFNQLIVPKGKRSSLTFSDGTRLYLNSGSQVIYPVTFNKKSREIYIRGEAYLEVAHNADWPFIVKTDHLDVKVLGTEFDIKSYPDENTSVVLVKGSVQAIVKSRKTVMKESELFTLDNADGKTSLGKTNVLEYVSWKDGWMYCTNERIDNIARKLSRYYDVKIQFNDDQVKGMTLTGKLDLKTECQEILNVISFIAPVDYKMIDGNIILSSKIK